MFRDGLFYRFRNRERMQGVGPATDQEKWNRLIPVLQGLRTNVPEASRAYALNYIRQPHDQLPRNEFLRAVPLIEILPFFTYGALEGIDGKTNITKSKAIAIYEAERRLTEEIPFDIKYRVFLGKTRDEVIALLGNELDQTLRTIVLLEINPRKGRNRFRGSDDVAIADPAITPRDLTEDCVHMLREAFNIKVR